MGAKENRQTVERLLKAVNTKDYGAIEEVATTDFVQEWPQSGERIRGAANARAINENYPAEQFPTLELKRVLVGEDFGVGEAKLDYAGKIYYGVTIFELKDGKVVRETDYFAEPFEAPEWRSKWVEKM
jgi:ketosteroid isomerase-like protein